MKKVAVIIVALIVVGAAIGAVYYYQGRAGQLAMERVVPEKPVLYIHLTQIKQSIEEFKASRFWDKVKAIDIEGLLKKTGAEDKDIQEYRDSMAYLQNVYAQYASDKVFGQELAAAVYMPALENLFKQDDPGAITEEIMSSFVVVTRIKPEAEVMEFVSRLYPNSSEKVKRSSAPYGKYEIVSVTIQDGIVISYAKIKDLLVIGNINTVKKSIDAFSKVKPALSDDAGYAAVKKNFPKEARLTAYLDLEKAIGSLDQVVKTFTKQMQDAKQDMAEIDENMKRLKGYKALGMAMASGNQAYSRFFIMFEKNVMEPSVAKALSVAPSGNRTINFVPDKVLAYQWGNNFDAKTSWDDFWAQMDRAYQRSQNGPSPAEITKSIDGAMGVNVSSELMPLFGSEFGGFLSDIEVGGFFPLPKFVLFAKVKEEIPVSRILSSALGKKGVDLSSMDYEGVTIKYVNLPFAMGFEPAYCFLDGYLLISTSRKVIIESIDAYNRKTQSLAENPDFKSVNFGLTDANNAVSYVKFGEVMNRAKEISKWAVNWMAFAQAGQASYSDALQEDLADAQQEVIDAQSELKTLTEAAQGQPADSPELQGINAQIAEKENEIMEKGKVIEEKKAEIETAKAKAKADADSAAAGKLFFNEVVIPVMEGLESIQAVGSRVTFGDGRVDSYTYYNVAK